MSTSHIHPSPAPQAAFLSSDDASWITGETFIVAGGTPSRL